MNTQPLVQRDISYVDTKSVVVLCQYSDHNEPASEAASILNIRKL